MKRVLYLHRYPPEVEAVQYAGMRPLLNALKQEFSVIYMGARTPSEQDSSLREGIHVEDLPFSLDPRSPRDKVVKLGMHYAALPLMLARIRRLKPDVILSKETLPFLPGCILRLGVPTILDISDWWWSIVFGHIPGLRAVAAGIENLEIAGWVRHGAYAAVHTSAEMRQLARLGFPAERMARIPVPHPRGVFSASDPGGARGELGFGDGDWVVAAHGVMHRSKGYDELLLWWRRVIRSRPRWRLLLIGAGGAEAAYRRQVRRLSLDAHVRFTGWVPSESGVNRLLNAADCLLVTRRNSPENWGVVPSALHHALAVGKPVVATGLPGIRDFIRQGENGFLFEPGNYDSFYETLTAIADDPEAAAKAAERGRQDVDVAFDSKAATEAYVAFIRRVAAAGPSQ